MVEVLIDEQAQHKLSSLTLEGFLLLSRRPSSHKAFTELTFLSLIIWVGFELSQSRISLRFLLLKILIERLTMIEVVGDDGVNVRRMQSLKFVGDLFRR